MKKSIILSTVIILFAVISYGQKAKTETIKIQTSGQCGMCKERIEKALAYEKGVKNSDYDEKTAIVTVEYNPEKTTPEKIRKAITAVGHDADDQPADAKAYSKLPECCKKQKENHTDHSGCKHN